MQKNEQAEMFYCCDLSNEELMKTPLMEPLYCEDCKIRLMAYDFKMTHGDKIDDHQKR
jgi:hypothetical protein